MNKVAYRTIIIAYEAMTVLRIEAVWIHVGVMKRIDLSIHHTVSLLL